MSYVSNFFGCNFYIKKKTGPSMSSRDHKTSPTELTTVTRYKMVPQLTYQSVR